LKNLSLDSALTKAAAFDRQRLKSSTWSDYAKAKYFAVSPFFSYSYTEFFFSASKSSLWILENKEMPKKLNRT